jgi:exodeoxyribonuclease (lambda-induced)
MKQEIKDFTQDTQDWLYSRVGKVTSSNFSKVQTKPKRTDVKLKAVPGVYDFGRAKKQKEEFERLLEAGEVLNSTFKLSDSIMKSLLDKKAIISKDIFNNTLSGTAESFKLSLLSELANSEPYEFDGKAIQHGNTYEPEARQEYEFINDVVVQEQGLQLLSSQLPELPEAEFIGASVDGLVGDDGLIEIKCPLNGARHLRCFTEDAVPQEHMAQIQGQMWVTGRKWCDFVSYNPFMMLDMKHLKMFTKRVYRDDDYIDNLANNVIKFTKLFIESRDKLKLPKSLEVTHV